jgi:hypothetical protein
MPTPPIWVDPRFRRFFAHAEETIEEAGRTAAEPWRAREEERLHRIILEVCGVGDEEDERELVEATR